MTELIRGARKPASCDWRSIRPSAAVEARGGSLNDPTAWKYHKFFGLIGTAGIVMKPSWRSREVIGSLANHMRSRMRPLFTSISVCLLLLAASSSQGSDEDVQASDVPPQAAASHFTVRTFPSTFSANEVDITNTAKSGFKWYPYNFFGARTKLSSVGPKFGRERYVIGRYDRTQRGVGIGVVDGWAWEIRGHSLWRWRLFRGHVQVRSSRRHKE